MTPDAVATRNGPPVPTLVVAPTSLRHLIRAFPVFEALAEAGRSLVVLAPSPFHRLLGLLPGVVDTLEPKDSEQLMVEALRGTGCQEALVLEESLDAAWLLRQSGIPRRWGYGGWLRRRLLEPGISPPAFTNTSRRRFGARTAGRPYYERLLQAVGIGGPGRWSPFLELPEELEEQGAAYLRRAQLPEDSRIVALVPGGEHRLSHRWPWQSFAELAQKLRQRIPGVRCTLLATAAELWPAVRVHEETARFVPVLGPDLDAADLAGTIARTHLVVGNSGGLLDLAGALQVPSLVLTAQGSGDELLAGQEALKGRAPGPLLSWVFRRSPLFSLEVETVLDRCESLLAENR